MDLDGIRTLKALTSWNISLLTGLEMALRVMQNWDSMPDYKKEESITSLRLLINNNKSYLFERPDVS